MGVRAPAELSAAEWIGENVRLGSWARSPRLDLESTPWMVRPLELAESNEVRVMVLRWPTGSGKSTFFEGLIAWIVAEDPGPCQCSHKTDDQSRRWVETRVVPVLELSDPTREILGATHRHQKRKLELILPHMFVLFGGASIGKLQDVSIQWVLGQEVWEWVPGMLNEAKARTHDRWNAREIYCGQGGVVGGDFEVQDAECAQWHWAFRCPECGEVVRYLPPGEPCEAFESRMRWDEELAGEDQVDWESLGETVRMRCDCGAEFEDEAQVRRSLTSSGEYVAEGNRHKPAQVSLSLPKTAVWWVPWRKTVERYLTARQAEDRGDMQPLAQFCQKDLAVHWEERAEVSEFEAQDYSREEYRPTEEGAPRWVDEAFRFLSVDVQKGHFWAVIRAWKFGGASRLLWEGKVATVETLRDLQVRYEVPNWCVAIDSRYRPEEVAKWRLRFGGKDARDLWTMTMGEESKGYPVRVRKVLDGKAQAVTLQRPFSQWVKSRATDGTPYRFIKFSNLRVKDLLSGLMGTGENFGVMRDHSEDYANHMRSEVKREVAPGKYRWEKVKGHYRNDLWDCECIGLVLAAIKGVLVVEED